MKKTESAAREVTLPEWIIEGTLRFGGDKAKWRFKCPICGNVQSCQDFVALGVKEPDRYVYFSCIGRFMTGEVGNITNQKAPCDYTLGGLFVLNKVTVINGDKKFPVFEFAD